MKKSATVPSGAAEKRRDLKKLMPIIFARYLASFTVYVASSFARPTPPNEDQKFVSAARKSLFFTLKSCQPSFGTRFCQALLTIDGRVIATAFFHRSPGFALGFFCFSFANTARSGSCSFHRQR